MDSIRIRGARQHNLKNIDVDLPRNTLIVITGVSGSGKSSLAFDTIFAEGQRRYVESLSTYARQFLELMDKPDVESIEGLSPAIAIEQKSASHNPRSTVGTTTEIYDYLRLLFASIGKVFCPNCKIPIQALSVQQMTDAILSRPEGTALQILAPLVEGRKGEYQKLFEQVQREGFSKVRVDGGVLDVGEVPPLHKQRKHTVEVLIDRLVLKEGSGQRLADSLETALRTGKGKVLLVEGKKEELLSEKHSCAKCGFSFGEISPRFFSFNSPYGACKACSGLGTQRKISIDRLIADPALTLAEGCISLYGPDSETWKIKQIRQLAGHFHVGIDRPWKDLPEHFKTLVLYGSEEEFPFLWVAEKSNYAYTGRFEGIVPNLERRFTETQSWAVRQEIEQFMAFTPCPDCKGMRLKKEALSVFVGEKSIAQVTRLSVEAALRFFHGLGKALPPKEAQIAQKILKEIAQRLQFLEDVGLPYLTLDRAAYTLSGGESQRIRLATQVGSKLTGVLYVLDEPSIGLHQRDNQKLLNTLLKLKALGNTVIVVEHDEETIRTADHIVDLGPGAGALGGHVVVSGPLKEVLASPKSLTGAYLSGRQSIPVPKKRRPGNGKALAILGAAQHNLKGIDVRFPLGTFCCVTGVSGSGKSTLIEDILYKAILWRLYSGGEKPGAHRTITGLEHLHRVIDIDQSPIGRTPRSNPATYTGCFTPIRELMAMTAEARARGYKPGRFSFNVKGGRCESCGGDGSVKIEMHFLPDVFVMCDVCGGKRYNRETLEVRYKGLDIRDILNLTVDQSAEFFKNHPAIVRVLRTVQSVGLGYITLGQPAPTLSGGEAQRIKLSRELSKRTKGHTLYLLDEPTVGLHADDVRKLLHVLHELVERGATVIVIEHNLDVIKTADWVVDLGPEGGDAGGHVVASGTPEQVAAVKTSYTGQVLRQVLKT
jgi:excinuclease ABC subunit A